MSVSAPWDPAFFDELDSILDELRTRCDETPQWEFCEGYMAALVCCRRAIPSEEYFDVLLGLGASSESDAVDCTFANAAQQQRFQDLWMQRWNDVQTALDAPIESLDDTAAYHPEVMDVRGAVALLPEVERAETAGQYLPAFGQIWALGFMYAVEAWPEEWGPPRDKKAAQWLDAAMQSIVTLTEDDEAAPEVSPFREDGPPSLSMLRLNAFANAVWAVYDMRELWRSIGPRVPALHRADTPGRNAPCACGSGKKYKKCCGT